MKIVTRKTATKKKAPTSTLQGNENLLCYYYDSEYAHVLRPGEEDDHGQSNSSLLLASEAFKS